MLHVDNPTVIFTLAAIIAVGVLTLGAHQADEAGHRRAALVLMGGALASLLAAVFGPVTSLAVIFLVAVYGVFVGPPVLLVVFVLRRRRRRTT